MINEIKVGDYVEVDIGNGWCISAYAQVITERAHPHTHVRLFKVKFKEDNKPKNGMVSMIKKGWM